MTTRTAASGSDGTPGQITSYTYNNIGQRTAATTSGQATSYTYDQTGKLTALTNPTGATSSYTYEASGLRSTTTTTAGTQRFVWDTTTTVPELRSDGDHQYVYGVGSTPIAQVTTADNTVDYLHTDLTGSVRTVTDHSGNVVADSDYTAYGTPSNVNGTPVSAVTPFGFAGQYTDPTGLLYLRARYYDPTTTQFLTIDPLTNTTHQPYGYTPGNPLQLTDPLGLDWMDNAGDFLAGFGDAVTFGGTKQIRRLINYELNGETQDVANSCAAAYTWGTVTGIAALTIATAGGGGSVAAGEDATVEGGSGLLSRLRGVDWADDTGSVRIPGSGSRLTTSQATQMADRIGYRPTSYLSRGEKVFTDGKTFITQDTTSHTGGLWKMANSVQDLRAGARLGTYDYDLNWIAP